MNQEEVYGRLTKVFQDVFDDESIALSPEMTAKDVSGWDSFNHVNLIVATELAFGIRFKTAELESLRNVGHFVEVISERLNQRGS